jgi:transcriptional regulator with XRE-family HTH domain
MDDNPLGRFIREQRESVAPETVGLPHGGRRRTPGLRRAELATLAGVSVDYLTRIEQGRDRHPSPEVLAAIADVLALDDERRRMLHHLGAVTRSTELCPESRPPERAVRPGLAALLDSLDPQPAVVHNRLGEVVASTLAWRRVMEPLVVPEGVPSLVTMLFADARSRTWFPGWATDADRLAGVLRGGAHRGDGELDDLVASLPPDGRDELTRRLAAAATAPASRGPRVLSVDHPVVGRLRLSEEVLDVASSELWLVAWLPADDVTAEAIRSLVHPRSALRAVAGDRG